MPHTLDQIVPSLQALGVLGYWLIGLASALEAFFLSGVIVPGTLIVDAGGILVQRGLLDFFDLAWFVAIGSVLGSEMGYWTGRLAMHRLPGRRQIEESNAFARARALFARRGGAALVIGRFLGPVAGLVPLAAAMAGMDRRRFLIWNVLGSIPYALAHVGIGYLLGDAMERIGGSLTRVAVLGGVVALLLVLLWAVLYSVLRLLPLALAVLSAAVRAIADIPWLSRRLEGHPQVVRWVEARFDRSSFDGLPLTLLGVFFCYVGAVWLDSAADFLAGDAIVRIDMRLAELLHHFQSPMPVRIASWITAFGGWQVVTPLVTASVLGLLLAGRRALAAGMVVSFAGNAASVALLKRAFGRPRSPLGYFAETSGSFPSGHAAASVAVYGMLIYVLWRTKRLRADTALLAAGLVAFAIGLSRIYLVEHYLSDVVNGWLVGAMWVTLGVAVAEWLQSRKPTPTGSPPATGAFRYAGVAAVVALACLAAANVWRYDHPRNMPMPSSDVLLAESQDLAVADAFPSTTESLLGSSLGPISLIVLERDGDALSRAMRAAGWVPSRPPSPGLIVDALYSAVEGNEDPTVETVAHFWNGHPNDLAFVSRADGTREDRGRRLHARFWRSAYVTPDGMRVYAGTAGVDEIDDPGTGGAERDNRAARDAVVQGLRAQGATILARIVLQQNSATAPQVTPPQLQTVILSLPQNDRRPGKP
ncbi:MAG: VTT domain-containing protein [Rhodobacteraceae bacterium]|nr:VTT domain-containing protein [Paracoccaceae bacterium]